MRRTVAALAILALVMMGANCGPRDPHPERTPCAVPSGELDREHCLQTGRQPAPER